MAAYPPQNTAVAAAGAPAKPNRTILYIIIAVVIIIIIVVVVVYLRSRKTTTTAGTSGTTHGTSGTGGTTGTTGHTGTTGTTGTTGAPCSGIPVAQTGYFLFSNQATSGNTIVNTTGICVNQCAESCTANETCEGFTYNFSAMQCILTSRLNYPGPPGNLGFPTSSGTNTYAKIIPSSDATLSSACENQGCGLVDMSTLYSRCVLVNTLANCSPCQNCNTQAAVTTCGSPQGTAAYFCTGCNSWRWIPTSTDGSVGYCLPYQM